ncbi:tigger transposable element-derived protein 1 [Trichonephila clavipes]|uniref:Tigger transposable element-derived protein 1 n=1 Tax=Trichonephila clavipes TaxID=2585209 RepID=A0A8X6WFA3_TRICX|nr:tigger transposable element-derived protein 1 [Trichonephila clavipes]
MSRFGGLSEERPSVFKTRSKLGTHLSTQCSGDERQSRPCAARESATADEEQQKIFPEELAKIIEDGDYSADQVFNADETGLYWKKLPNRTYIAKDEKTASGHKASKDRVTLLLCKCIRRSDVETSLNT